MSTTDVSRTHGLRGRLLLAVFAGLVVALGLAALTRAAHSATLGLISFTRADGIYVMHPDGTGIRPLRRGPVASHASQLDWSPDGRRLAFLARGAIWLLGADGKGLVRLVSPADVQGSVGSPSWSPDGRRLAISVGLRNDYPNDRRDNEIWVVNADGSQVRQLTRLPGLRPDNDGCAGIGSTDWSPDGRRIALTAHCAWFAYIYVVNADGTNLRRLSEKGWAWAVDPHWSSDSRRIVYEAWPPTRHGGDNLGEIFVMDVDAGSKVRLTKNAAPDNRPVWSPDGRRIAFVRGDDAQGSSEIYAMNADGTGLTRLTHNRLGEGSPAWQPVGAP